MIQEVKMKVAVSSTGKNLTSQIDPRFGRCAYFMIVETDDMSFEAFDNENIALSGGAGIQSATFMSSKDVAAILTGNCGPNAMKTLSAAGIKVFTGQAGTVKEAVERYKTSTLQPTTQPTVAEKSGVGTVPDMQSNMMPRGGSGGGGGRGGGGRCMGGSGRGMGMGQGAGLRQSAANASMGQGSAKEELAALKKQAAEIQKQIENIESKLDQ